MFFINSVLGIKENTMKIEKIRDIRKRQGLSQWALAIRVNRSGPWLGLREAGYVEATQEELEALSAALSDGQSEPLHQAGGAR
jgi:predicted transcriptional regulator